MDKEDLQELKNTIVPGDKSVNMVAQEPSADSRLAPNHPIVIKRRKVQKHSLEPRTSESPGNPSPTLEDSIAAESAPEEPIEAASTPLTGELKPKSRRRVVIIDPAEESLQKLQSEKTLLEPRSKKKKGKYQHKPALRPPKRVRKILTRDNPEILKKVAELLELEKIRDPEAARIREERQERNSKAQEQKGAISQKMNKKAQRYLKKYGITPTFCGDSMSTKKALSFKMLFCYSPLEEMSDPDALANIRLLFLAHADHNVPKTLNKFMSYMKNNMCFGISDDQLERVVNLLISNNYLIVNNDRVTLNIS
jgi:hypothetical protein